MLLSAQLGTLYVWRHMWVEFVVGSLLCFERFFSGYSGFPLSSKTNTSKFQFDQDQVVEEPLCGCATSKSLFIYLFIHLLCFRSAALRPDHPYSFGGPPDHWPSNQAIRPPQTIRTERKIRLQQTLVRPDHQIRSPHQITDHEPWLLGLQSAQHIKPFELIQVRCILYGLGQGGYIELWMNLAKHTFHTLSA